MLLLIARVVAITGKFVVTTRTRTSKPERDRDAGGSESGRAVTGTVESLSVALAISPSLARRRLATDDRKQWHRVTGRLHGGQYS